MGLKIDSRIVCRCECCPMTLESSGETLTAACNSARELGWVVDVFWEKCLCPQHAHIAAAAPASSEGEKP